MIVVPAAADTTVGGTISTDTTWTAAGSPYIVTSHLKVQGADGADGITTLTIEPGTEVRFNANLRLSIGYTSGSPGALVAQGTVADPIVFTSNKTTPSPGDWIGVRFYTTADAASTLMEHCRIEYAGNAYGAIYVSSASPTFTNTVVQNSGYCDIYYTGTVGGSVSDCTFNSGISLLTTNSIDFSGNTFNQNNSYPTKVYADDVHELVNGNTFANLDAASVLWVDSGNVTKDATWTAAIPIFLKNDVRVQGSDGTDNITTLTIDPGAQLRFGASRKLIIGYTSGSPGALVAQGTAADPIVLTSNQATPSPGDWIGVRFYTTADAASTLMEHCRIEYAGNAYGAIYVSSASPTLRNTVVQNSGYCDIYYTGTVGGSVSDCTFNSGISLLATSSVDFSGNTFNQNNSYPTKAYADDVHNLVNGNTFANLDANSYLEINSGDITKDSTWTSAIPIHVKYSLTVKGTDGADAITTLTIEPGAMLKFYTGKSLVVGAASGDPGALVAQGTAANPITLTSSQTTPAAGDWYGIKIYNTSDDATTRLENCLIAYPGKSGSAFAAAVEITNAAPSLVNCSFTDSYYYDLKYAGTVGGTVSGCSLNHGIWISTTSTVDFTGNTINYNNDFPVKAWADNVHSLVNGNTYNDLDAGSFLDVDSGNLTRDATWTGAIPLVLKNDLIVQGTDGDDSMTTLSIEAGAKIKLYGGRKIQIGGSTGDPGAFIAQGAADNMILITSNLATPNPADWYGITFAATASQTSLIDHCVIEYGGRGGRNIYLYNRNVAITNNIIRNNSGIALYITGENCSGADIRCNTFENNSTGIYITGALPNIENNNFINNSYCGLRSYYTAIVAENNWWNDAAGPNQAGDTTMGDVDADPWSTQINQCSSGGSNNPPNEPTDPSPADNEVRVSANSSITLTWAGGDPDSQDTVVYDIYLGTSPEALAMDAQDVSGVSHTIDNPISGITYYWQVTARDSQGLEVTGPVWRFTTTGGYPDLTISNVVTDPPGNLQTGQDINIIATVMNGETGPVVDGFAVDVKIDGASIGTLTVNEVMLAGQSIQLSAPWTYAGGNPTVTVKADSQSQVYETDEQNNQFDALFNTVADMTAPYPTSTSPADGAFLQQVDQVEFTLVDTQSAVDDAAVISNFSMFNSNQETVTGDVTETNDTFTFSPATVPLPDDQYTVSLAAFDIHGNTQTFTYSFTVDSQPPAKPVITGGPVASGNIQARPVQNTSNEFVIDLTGTRDDGTSVFINAEEQVEPGDAPWSVKLRLQPGDNALEVWLKDRAGNQGASEWVDIQVSTGNGIQFDYDASGRVKRITSMP